MAVDAWVYAVFCDGYHWNSEKRSYSELEVNHVEGFHP